jgi:uncharacterized membrane protein
MTKLLLAHLSLGPLLLLLALLYKKFPPAKINHWYGYRTPRSMRSQQAWNYANAFSAQAMVLVSGSTVLLQIVFYFTIGGKESLIWSAGVLVAGLLLSIVFTERQLKQQGFQ